MYKILKTAALAGLIGLTSLAAVPAQAESLYLGFGDRSDDGRVGVYLGDDGRVRERDRFRERDIRRVERRCTTERALYKAERLGIRRARIADVDRDSIVVRGRSHGDRVTVVFARNRNCSVIG